MDSDCSFLNIFNFLFSVTSLFSSARLIERLQGLWKKILIGGETRLAEARLKTGRLQGTRPNTDILYKTL